MSMVWDEAKLAELAEQERESCLVVCRMLRPLAGGVPATRAGIEAFVQYQMGIPRESAEFAQAVDKVEGELGGKKLETPEGELEEEQVYALNALRRGEDGAPYILGHQVRALWKQAASRIGLFVKTQGSKGCLAEMGSAIAAGKSLRAPKRPWEIYLCADEEGAPAKTHFETMRGTVSTPKGKKSIQTVVEAADPGTLFSYQFRWSAAQKKQKPLVSKDDVARIVAVTRIIGIGSALSFEYGRFEVLRLEV